MSNFLILSDTNFEDEDFVIFRQDLSGQLKGAGHSVDVLLNGPFYLPRLLLLSRKADIIFTPNFPSINSPVLMASRFLKKKLFVKVVSDYVWESAIDSGRTFFLINDFQKSNKTGQIASLWRRQTQLCKKADAVITSSKFLAGIVNGWGIDKEKIKVISDAINFQMPDISKEGARKKLAIPGNLIISVGELMPWRGFRMLVKMMPQLLQINQFFRLIIVGEGPDYKILQAMIKNLNLDKKVYLAGKKTKEELAYYIAASDIFILNSSHEGFPHRALEAMSAGVPVITTAMGVNSELIKQGQNGFIVKYNDEFNLIEAVKTVWQAPELREQFIEEGAKTALHFKSEKMLEETIKAISQKP